MLPLLLRMRRCRCKAHSNTYQLLAVWQLKPVTLQHHGSMVHVFICSCDAITRLQALLAKFKAHLPDDDDGTAAAGDDGAGAADEHITEVSMQAGPPPPQPSQT
jgi:hypothetical protein